MCATYSERLAACRQVGFAVVGSTLGAGRTSAGHTVAAAEGTAAAGEGTVAAGRGTDVAGEGMPEERIAGAGSAEYIEKAAWDRCTSRF